MILQKLKALDELGYSILCHLAFYKVVSASSLQHGFSACAWWTSEGLNYFQESQINKFRVERFQFAVWDLHLRGSTKE